MRHCVEGKLWYKFYYWWMPLNDQDFFSILKFINQLKISKQYASQLKCSYATYDPYLIIGPVKQELLYLDPLVIMFHDVITDKQIETMKKLSTAKVKNLNFFNFKSTLSI